LHENGDSDEIKMFDNKIITLVKFRTTALPINFQHCCQMQCALTPNCFQKCQIFSLLH